MYSAPTKGLSISRTDMSRFTKLCKVAFETLLSAAWYILSIPVGTCVCLHSHCICSRIQTFNLHHHVPKCLVRLERSTANKITAFHEEMIGSAMQQCNIGGALVGMEAESVSSPRSHGTGEYETWFAVLDCAFLFIEIFRGRAKKFAKKVDELLYCENFDIGTIRDGLKSVPFCSELLWESSSTCLTTRSLKMRSWI